VLLHLIRIEKERETVEKESYRKVTENKWVLPGAPNFERTLNGIHISHDNNWKGPEKVRVKGEREAKKYRE